MAISAFANQLQLPVSTVKRYLALLELVYIARRIPAWSANLTTRAVATPKLMTVDSGLAGHLTGLTTRHARHPTAPVGPIVENFVLGELARQLAWSNEPARLYHYRDRDGREVDAILEHASGEVVAIEVKAAETVRREDFRGIQHLARRIGDQLLAGLVQYAGGTPLPFGAGTGQVSGLMQQSPLPPAVRPPVGVGPPVSVRQLTAIRFLSSVRRDTAPAFPDVKLPDPVRPHVVGIVGGTVDRVVETLVAVPANHGAVVSHTDEDHSALTVAERDEGLLQRTA